MKSEHTTLPAHTGMMLLSFWLRLRKKFQRKEALFFLEIVCAVGQCRATHTCNAADVHSKEETPFLCSVHLKFPFLKLPVLLALSSTSHTSSRQSHASRPVVQYQRYSAICHRRSGKYFKYCHLGSPLSRAPPVGSPGYPPSSKGN